MNFIPRSIGLTYTGLVKKNYGEQLTSLMVFVMILSMAQILWCKGWGSSCKIKTRELWAALSITCHDIVKNLFTNHSL